jgi:type VI secretion system protein ImpA
MPISEELLKPIAGPNPGGVNLRYDPIYDKIKEARREDDDAGPQGEWARELKKADWPLVIKLCNEALGSRTKDLQLAAWLTEALVHREGFAGLGQGLGLCAALVEQFWDNLYPEPEDGDLELRAMPLDWIGGHLDVKLKKIPLCKNGFDWIAYKESRAVGYETDIGDSEAKRAAREQAIADQKLTAEEFDKAFAGTPKAFYQQRMAEIDGCMEAVNALDQTCTAKFGTFNPSFAGLREALEAVRQAVNVLLVRKRETEPDEAGGAEPMPAEEAAPAAAPGAVEAAPRPAMAAAAPRKMAAATEPASREEACERIAALAAWLRQQDAYDPAPYVMVRVLRWSELRAAGGEIDANLLAAPSTELRTRIKQLWNDGNYGELFPVLEAAAAQPCGRGWLDLQRYFCQACDNAGSYDYVKNAVLAELKALLADYPQLPKMSLLDDTPTANAETQAWLQPLLRDREAELRAGKMQAMGVAPDNGQPVDGEEAGEAKPPDVFVLAKQAVESGHTDEAVALLTREAAMERGRARFQRHVQLAQLCVAAGYNNIAYPILQGLAEEIESRRLEEWESAGMLAHVFTLLFRCVDKMRGDPELKQKLYARVCRLDPVQALELER